MTNGNLLDFHEEEGSKKINVIDYNGSGKDIVSNHTLSMDNEELVSENVEEFKDQSNKLTMIHEDRVNGGMLSGNSSRNSKKILALDSSKGEHNNSKKEDSQSSIKNAVEEGKVFIKKYRARAKSYRDKCVQEKNSEVESNNKSKDKEGKKNETKNKEQKQHNNLTNGSKTINIPTRGTEECSTMFTMDQGVKGSSKKQIRKLNPIFLSQMARDCKDLEKLSLSTAGVLFTGDYSSSYITDKGQMFQSFSTYKPTFPTGFSSNIKQVTGNSSSTMKRLEDSNECSGILKLKRRELTVLNKLAETGN